jgi:hypothetical protein
LIINKPYEPKNAALLSCLCETEFIEFNRETFYQDPPETYVTIYHCNTDIKMGWFQKLYACWCIITKGRALLYDVILTDAEVQKLKDWVNNIALDN